MYKLRLGIIIWDNLHELVQKVQVLVSKTNIMEEVGQARIRAVRRNRDTKGNVLNRATHLSRMARDQTSSVSQTPLQRAKSEL